MPTISGTVYDHTGAAAAGRIVRAYRRDTGAFLGQTTTGTGAATPGDPNFSNVTLLLRMNSSFADSSPLAQALSVKSGAPAISSLIKKFGAGSGDFRRTGALLIPSGMDFGTGDFTVETWAYWNTAIGASEWGAFQLSTPSSGYEASQGNLALIVAPGPVYAFYVGTYVATSAVVTTGSWHHLAIARQSGLIRAFLNGTKILDQANTFNFSDPFGVIGGYYNNSFNGDVLLDDFRVTKGVARYSADFTPPGAEFYDAAEIPAAAVGTYSVDVGGFAGQCNVIALDDDAGTVYNDLIKRVTPA